MIQKSLPDTFGQLANLKDRIVTSCELETLSDRVGSLKAVRNLRLIDSGELSVCLNLSALEHLTIQDSQRLRVLPDSVGGLSALRRLQLLTCVESQSLPESFAQFANLECLIGNCGSKCS